MDMVVGLPGKQALNYPAFWLPLTSGEIQLGMRNSEVSMRELNSLVVADNPFVQKIIVNVLKEYGSCDAASNGMEGLEYIKQSISKHKFYELFCLDIEMPKLNGLKLLETIRMLEQKLETKKKCIIIMVTSHSEKEMIKKCCQLGCDSFLLKPIYKNNLIKVLQRHKLI